MPLRDHFRPPVDDRHMWEELHAGWPAMLVLWLFDRLPPGYVSAPFVRRGMTPENGDPDEASPTFIVGGEAAPAPTLTLEADLSEPDEYEVRVYDDRRERRLVAAIELVSPSNKDRPEHRRAFVAKTAALVRQDVCVAIVDVVTVRQSNLYGELVEFLGPDPGLGPEPPPVYAASVRGRKRHRPRPVIDTWFHPLAVGEPLPSLPLWLDVDLGVTLDLEASYEDTCRVLHIA